MLAAGAGEQVDLGAGQVDRRGEQRHRTHLEQDLLGFVPPEGDVVKAQSDGVGVEPHRPCETGLRIEVDEQDPLAELREGGAEGVDGGGLGHPALLIGDGQHAGHSLGV